MVSEQTHKNFNALMHKLNTESYMFSGVAAAFRKAGHHGFGYFASWEGQERWEYAKKVQTCIEKLGLAVMMPAIPEVKTDYPNPVDAIKTMLNADMAILKIIDAGMKAAGQATEWYTVKKMAWIYGEMLGQYNEVNGVLKKLQGAGNDYGAIIEINEWLTEKFGNHESD